MTTPIDPKALAVLMNQTFSLWRLPENWENVSPFYREVLEDVPIDLVQASLKHLRQTLKWFPRPAELRAPIAAELERRRTVLLRLETMKLKASKGDVEQAAWIPKTPEEKAEAEEIAAKTKLMLSAIQRVPTEEVEDLAAITRNEKRREALAVAYKALDALKDKPKIPLPSDAARAAAEAGEGELGQS